LTKHLGPFLSKGWVDGALKWGTTNDLENTYHPMHHGRVFDRNDSLEKCMSMGVDHVQLIVNNLNDFLTFLCLMHLSCLVPSIIQHKKRHWLERLTSKFKLLEVQRVASRDELLEFVETLRHKWENESQLEA
jgi:hypothetical protein